MKTNLKILAIIFKITKQLLDLLLIIGSGYCALIQKDYSQAAYLLLLASLGRAI